MGISRKTEKSFFIKPTNLCICFIKIYYIILSNILLNLPSFVFLLLFLYLKILKRNYIFFYYTFFILYFSFLIALEELLHIVFYKLLYKIYSFEIKIIKFLNFPIRIEVRPSNLSLQISDPRVFILPPFIIFLIFLFLFFISFFTKQEQIFLNFVGFGIIYSLLSIIPLGPLISNDGFNAMKILLKKRKKI